jgi:hypothetical protein
LECGNLLSFGRLLALGTFQNDRHYFLLHARKGQFVAHGGERAALGKVNDPAGRRAMLDQVTSDHAGGENVPVLRIGLDQCKCLFRAQKETRVDGVLASEALLGVLVCNKPARGGDVRLTGRVGPMMSSSSHFHGLSLASPICV